MVPSAPVSTKVVVVLVAAKVIWPLTLVLPSSVTEPDSAMTSEPTCAPSASTCMLCSTLLLALVRVDMFCSDSVCDSWVNCCTNWDGSVGDSGSWFWICATSSLVNMSDVSLAVLPVMLPLAAPVPAPLLLLLRRLTVMA